MNKQPSLELRLKIARKADSQTASFSLTQFGVYIVTKKG